MVLWRQLSVWEKKNFLDFSDLFIIFRLERHRARENDLKSSNSKNEENVEKLKTKKLKVFLCIVNN